MTYPARIDLRVGGDYFVDFGRTHEGELDGVIVKVVPERLLRYAWASYPAIVTFVVVVTANHFWLDAAFGAAVAGISAVTASAALGRARPEAWAWRRAVPAEATA